MGAWDDWTMDMHADKVAASTGGTIPYYREPPVPVNLPVVDDFESYSDRVPYFANQWPWTVYNEAYSARALPAEVIVGQTPPAGIGQCMLGNAAFSSGLHYPFSVEYVGFMATIALGTYTQRGDGEVIRISDGSWSRMRRTVLGPNPAHPDTPDFAEYAQMRVEQGGAILGVEAGWTRISVDAQDADNISFRVEDYVSGATLAEASCAFTSEGTSVDSRAGTFTWTVPQSMATTNGFTLMGLGAIDRINTDPVAPPVDEVLYEGAGSRARFIGPR